MNREFYDNEREIDLAEQKTLHRREKKIVAARSLVFLGAAASFAIGWDSSTHYCYIISAILAMIFIRLINYHDYLKRRKNFLKSRLAVVNSYLARAKGTWRKRSNDGSIYLKNDRPQDEDLHIFGVGSIYQYICAARTKRGRDLLAEAFTPEAKDFNELRNRQRGVQELLQRPRLALDLEAYGRLMPNNHDTSELIASVEEEQSATGKIYALRYVQPVLVIFCTLLYAFGLAGWEILCGVIILGVTAGTVAIPAVNERVRGLKVISKELRAYERIFERLESTNFISKRLIAIRDILTDEVQASEELRRLRVLVELLRARRNPVFFIVWNGLFLGDLHLAKRYMCWREAVRWHLDSWLNAHAEVEVLMSLATIGQTRERYTFPIFYEEPEPHIKAEGLKSLLVAEERGVGNNVELQAGTMIITGANMSGKTTWIRTLAGAVMLAYAGAPVCAKNFHVSALKVLTSIRVNDDLSQGLSTFYAELMRIKTMIEATERGERLLICIDEIFKGTNSNDRVSGAKEAIRRLTTERNITLLTTHDFELCELEKENSRITNGHFEEHYEGDEIKFDYKLREGRTHTTNAKYLLKLVGINIE